MLALSRVLGKKLPEHWRTSLSDSRSSQRADLARVLQPFERLERFLKRNGTAPTQQVKVDDIHPKPQQTAVASLHGPAYGRMMREDLLTRKTWSRRPLIASP